jgi:hypothetical protein
MTTHPYTRLFVKTTAPTVSDDSSTGYEVGDFWINTVSGNIYHAVSVAVGAASWVIANGVTNGNSHDHVGGDGNLITEDALSFSNVATGNATTTAHGLLLRAVAPSSGNLNVVGLLNGATQFSNLGILDSTNPAPIGTAAPGTEVIVARRDHVHAATPAGVGAIPNDGWQARTETWTRTGNHTFTVSSDLTATFRKGTKIRYKDGGSYEYGVVGSSSFASSTTTVNLIPNTDYAMAAATITDTYISYIENPEGFPDTFNYTATAAPGSGAWSGSPAYTIAAAKWKVIGKQIKVDGQVNITTNNTGAGQVNFDVPITIATASVGVGREGAITGNELQAICDATTTIAKLFTYNNAYPGGTSYQLQFNVMYGF